MRLIRLSSTAAAFSLAGFSVGCGGGGGGGTDAPPVGPAAAVSAVSGSGSSVTAGSTSPIALVAKVADAGGRAVPGASVSWGTASGSISPGSSTTDGSGQTTAQWTPGKVAGAQTASASVSGASTATFSATVAAGALAKIKLTPDTTKLASAGATAQMTATGLDAFDNTVSGLAPTFTIDAPTIATVNSTGLLTAVANGTTTVRATSGSIAASAIVIVNIVAGSDPCTGVTLTLAVGGSQTLTGAAANQFCVNGAAGAEFVAIPFYATGNGGTGSGQGTGTRVFAAAPTLNATFTPLTNTTVSGPPSPSVASDSRLRGAMLTEGGRAMTRDVAWESRFRERARRELRPFFGGARKQARQPSGARNNIGISADVKLGDVLQLNVNADKACSDAIIHSATVKAVTTHTVIVNDDANPSGADGFTTADFQFFANLFDSQVWPVDTDNFGVPTDVDLNNNRVLLFFTTAVNALTPKGSNSFVGGFFFGRDIIPKTPPTPGAQACLGSNYAEMFYLLAPDPGSPTANAFSTSFVKSITIGTVAHEFQHLINFSRHISELNPTPFTAAEETFLDEGLAHVAEELNFYAATGRSPRNNIDAPTLTNIDDAYRAFGRQNAIRFREYLKNPDRYPPYSVLADTSLAVRGGIWSFLRYATDRRSSSVAEKSTWFLLVNPNSNVQGVKNLTEVFGADVLLQMRDWAVANYLDDAISASVPTAFQHPSWNTRSVETYVNGPQSADGTVFPLKTQSLLSTPIPLQLADGGAAYLRFGVAANLVGGATVTSPAALPTTFSITVVRTK